MHWSVNNWYENMHGLQNIAHTDTEAFDSLGCCWGREKTVWREGVLLKYGPGGGPSRFIRGLCCHVQLESLRYSPGVCLVATDGMWPQLRLERRRTPALTHRPTSGPGTARQPPILRAEHWGDLTILTLISLNIVFTICAASYFFTKILETYHEFWSFQIAISEWERQFLYAYFR